MKITINLKHARQYHFATISDVKIRMTCRVTGIFANDGVYNFAPVYNRVFKTVLQVERKTNFSVEVYIAAVNITSAHN